MSISWTCFQSVGFFLHWTRGSCRSLLMIGLLHTHKCERSGRSVIYWRLCLFMLYFLIDSAYKITKHCHYCIICLLQANKCDPFTVRVKIGLANQQTKSATPTNLREQTNLIFSSFKMVLKTPKFSNRFLFLSFKHLTRGLRGWVVFNYSY